MMLRTTILRLRKVCSVGFIPRILRGDQSNLTVTSAVIRKANRTTKATDDGQNALTDKSNDLNCRFASAAELKIDDEFRKKIDEASGLADKPANENEQPMLTPRLPLTHHERCKKIIDKAFGKVSNTQHDEVLGEQYFSHTVNLEDTRRKIHESEKAKLKLQEQALNSPLLPDSRTQYSIFNMSRELNVKDDNRDEIIVTDSAPSSEPDLSKNLENVKGTAEETLLVEEPNLSQAKEDFDKCVDNPDSTKRNALCDDDDAETIEVIKDEGKPYLYQNATAAHQLPWILRPPVRELPVNDNQESVENRKLFDDDAETVKLVKDERILNINTVKLVKDERILNTTTAKEEEELLTQKLETIEETPVVEAQKPKLEGFNVTPKVLGNDPIYSCKIIEDKPYNKLDYPEALDEVSKCCLNCPLGKIDEMLISEMEKHGMTCRSTHNAPSTPMEDDIVQMDVLNKQPISTIEDQEMLSENPEHGEKENERATDSGIPEENEQTEALKKSVAISEPTEDAKDILNPENIRTQIKPQDSKSEEYNPADTRVPVMCTKIEGPLPLDGPIHKGTLSETPNSHAFINNQNAQLHSVQSVEEHNLGEISQNAQTESAATEEKMMPAEHINTNIESVDPLRNASVNNIKLERFLKPEYSFEVVNKPSYGGIMNASTCENVHQTSPKEANEAELYGQTPTQESTTEVQGELQENQTAANSLFVKAPDTNVSTPGENTEYSPTADNITQQCSIPEKNPDKASLSEEILKDHTLDPHYVLTCNETCPISPSTAMSWDQNSDFVDTTDTIYMKKNVTESVRPKPRETVESANVSSDTYARPNLLELENQPEIERTTSMPGAIKSLPEVGEQMALSALLKKVRERSRLSYDKAHSKLDVEAVGKCGTKFPRCQPTAPRSPPTDPIPLPTFGLPKLKRRPPVCKPVKKPSNKCSSCTTNDGGNHPVMPNVLNEAEVCAVISKVTLTDEVIDRLQNLGKNLGKNLGGVLREAKSNIEMLLAKDYEPWTPIPSWKIPQKTEKEWRPGMSGLPPCVDGCPVFPKARTSMKPEPPCDLRPCEGFPKRRSFSMLDCFTVTLGENKVYDLGDF